MINQVTMFTINCDKCNVDILAESTYSCVSEESLDEELEEWNWKEINDKHYCPNCVVFDEQKDEWSVKND